MPSFNLTFLCFSIMAASATGRDDMEVGVYNNQGSLVDTCNSGNYQIVIIAFNISLSKAQTPELNLTTHCNPATNNCTKLRQGIKSCQGLGIKVLLSIGGAIGKHNLNSTEPTNFAAYLWNNFLGGNSNSRPITDAVFDGVDITNELGPFDNWGNWNSLAAELKQLYEKQGRKFYLSAVPQCLIVAMIGNWIPTPGVFDYIWVQFFGDNLICQYLNGRLQGFWESWNVWKTFSAGKVFVKLLASPIAEGMGYIPVHVWRNQVLPELRRSSNFGGVILWSHELDRGYSSEINPKVCGLPGPESLSENYVNMFPMGANYAGQRVFKSTCAGTCVID